MVAVTRHPSTPANAGGDSLPDRLQPFQEGLVEESFAIESAGGDSAQDAEPEVRLLVTQC